MVWEYRAGQGGVLGGIEWGSAVDGERAYFAVSDILQPQPGGLHAVRWPPGSAPGSRRRRRQSAAPAAAAMRAQSAAVTAIPGVVFSGSNDGALRAYSTTNRRDRLGVRHQPRVHRRSTACRRKGASMIGPGPVVAGGMVFVNSGYGAFGGRPGNVLLAFGADAKV